MSLIRNLVSENEKKDSNKSNNDTEDADNKNPRPVIKSALDLQRLKLEKLMKNPEKLVVIPDPRREKDYMQSVPSFVRNVMGSSAGAGSGEFHVYRHLRRKEYARQKMIQHKSAKELLDDEYRNKLEENRRIAEDKTAKKRAKRLKKKKNAKKPKQQTRNEVVTNADESCSDESIEPPISEADQKEELKEVSASSAVEKTENKTEEPQATEDIPATVGCAIIK